MKKSVFFVTAFLYLYISFTTTQAQSWQWANTTTGNDEDRGHDVAVDLSGNVYVTGYFDTSSVTFGTFTLTNEGSDDYYLVKYDAAGNVLWALSNGGNMSEMGNSVACDSAGNVYVTGSFESQQLLFGNDTIINSSMHDVFVAKYDPAGNEVWAMSFGGVGDEYANEIVTDDNGYFYLTGRFTSPSLTFDTTVLTATGTSKIFLVKYDTDGNVIWARGTNGPSFDQKSVVNYDKDGNVYLVGDYYEYTLFAGTDTFLNAGLEDIYLIKYDSNGNFMWATSWGGSSGEKVTGVAADDNGDIYLSGYYYSPFIVFGSFTLNNNSFGAWDLYMLKLDSNANVTRVFSCTNPENDEITGLSFVNNYLYVTGWYQDTLHFGSTTIQSNGSIDVYITKFDTTFNPIWSVSAGGTLGDASTAIATDLSGNSYITGFYESASISFGSSTITDNFSGWDTFIAKLVEGTIGIQKTEVTDFRIYPNPTNGILHLENIDSNKAVSIVNEFGKIIYHCNSCNIEINLSGFAKGIYFIHVNSDNANPDVQKLIIN